MGPRLNSYYGRENKSSGIREGNRANVAALEGVARRESSSGDEKPDSPIFAFRATPQTGFSALNAASAFARFPRV